MASALRDELRQRRPFETLEQEAHLNVVRTAAVLTDALERVVKPAGLTLAQFNALRILRGAEPGGLCRNELRDRLVTRMPDVTRLLDRLEQAGLVVRERSDADRRLVRTRITAGGLALLAEVDPAVRAEHRQLLGHLGPDDLRTLSDLLTRARAPG
jgi:DNA-binding MarR family transcriptional regulator